MRKTKHLVDAYAYPGFRPPRTVEGLFGDRFARIVVLKRRGKKPSAGPVVRSIGPAMTAADEEEHVPRLVEIGSGPHTTLVNLPCFVNLCR